MSDRSYPATRRKPTLASKVLAGSMLLLLVALAASPDRVYFFDELRPVAPETTPDDSEALALERERQRADKDLRSLTPRGTYVVVDTQANRLFVRRGEKILLEAPCSTGSGELLRDPESGREWIFDTPRGRFRVLRKVRDPVWTKPDWAYIELGEKVPETWSQRRDAESLGEYALHFGNGYMIHGTLYQRYIGRSITHGCIRLGDEALERVYNIVPTGAEILIF